MQSWLKALVPSDQPTMNNVAELYAALGFYSTPDLRLPVAYAGLPNQPLQLSPLQVALSAAVFSNAGVRPAPRLVMAVKTPSQGWVVLPALSKPVQVLPPGEADSAIRSLVVGGQPFWQWSGLAGQGNKTVSWSLTGTLPDSQGVPLAVVVLLEDPGQQWASYIGLELLAAAKQP
jgi:hypothetical protein